MKMYYLFIDDFALCVRDTNVKELPDGSRECCPEQEGRIYIIRNPRPIRYGTIEDICDCFEVIGNKKYACFIRENKCLQKLAFKHIKNGIEEEEWKLL